MATLEIVAQRRAQVVQRLDAVKRALVESTGIEVGEQPLTNKDTGIAQIQQLENLADLLEALATKNGEMTQEYHARLMRVFELETDVSILTQERDGHAARVAELQAELNTVLSLSDAPSASMGPMSDEALAGLGFKSTEIKKLRHVFPALTATTAPGAAPTVAAPTD